MELNLRASMIDPPGAERGPCADPECGHEGCELARARAEESYCIRCGERIWYGRAYVDLAERWEPQHYPAMDRELLAHRDCEERAQEIRIGTDRDIANLRLKPMQMNATACAVWECEGCKRKALILPGESTSIALVDEAGCDYRTEVAYYRGWTQGDRGATLCPECAPTRNTYILLTD